MGDAIMTGNDCAIYDGCKLENIQPSVLRQPGRKDPALAESDISSSTTVVPYSYFP